MCLFEEKLDDVIPDENLIRFVDAYVDKLDLILSFLFYRLSYFTSIMITKSKLKKSNTFKYTLTILIKYSTLPLK